VLWDSHPLRLGATPQRVWVDGALQIPRTHGAAVDVGRGKEDPGWDERPAVPDWRRERERAVEWEGLPPLDVAEDVERGRVVFHNVSAVYVRGRDAQGLPVVRAQFMEGAGAGGVVMVERGTVVCAAARAAVCVGLADVPPERTVDLHGGMLAPALIAFGSPLGLEEIAYEPGTGDGRAYDAFTYDVPRVLGDSGALVCAADALQFQTRNAL